MKKLLLFASAFLAGFLLNAESFHIKCPYDNVPDEAKGVYLASEGNLKGYTIDGKYIDLHSKFVQISGESNLYIFAGDSSKYNYNLFKTDFVKFDKSGNAYVIYCSDYNQKNNGFIFKYNPVLNECSQFPIKGNHCLPVDFAVSDDGQWLFVYYLDETVKDTGTVTVSTIPVKNPDAAEIIFSGVRADINHRVIENLCFDSNTQRLYFYYSGEDHEKNITTKPGLFFLTSESGEYKKTNINKYSIIRAWAIENLININTKNGITDYEPALQEIKAACDYHLKPEEIEFSLKIFKNSEFSELYQEDENGNPLTEVEALKYIYEKQRNIFNDYIYNYCFNEEFEYVFPDKIFPVENFCFVKASGESAYNPDYAYVHSVSSYDSKLLFTNETGLWALTIFNYRNTVLYQITDSNGNFIPRQNEKLKQIYLDSIYKDGPRDLIVGTDYLLFLPRSKSHIYCYKNNDVYDLSINFPGVEQFNYFHMEEILEKGLLPEINLNEPKEKNSSLQIIVILCVSLFLVIILLVIVSIIGIHREKELKSERPSVNALKKNKKFIFDIQETERGKISRDIHDSIIQDIRAIRLNADMIEVSPEYEERKQNILRIATESVVKLRNICYNLTPAELATHADGDNSKIELISIIQTLVTQFIERTHVPCAVQIDESFTYPVFEKEISQNLFRIIQEALNNIEKHSYATHCSIFIRSKDEGKNMVIYISDDGIGCDMKNLNHKLRKNHFGLQNIKERAKLIGAELEFKSAPGEGMEIRLTLPLQS